MSHPPIEDHAFIGNGRTGALITTDGSIVWLCLPDFDSHACLAALLGTPEHGHWRITPRDDATTTRRYLPDSMVLETTHETATGTVRVTDLMPHNEGRTDILRRVEGIDGEVVMNHSWLVRPWYGRRVPWVRREEDALTAIAGPDRFVLRGPHLPESEGDGEFTVSARDVLDFDFSWQPSHAERCDLLDAGDAIGETVQDSRSWLGDCAYEGPWQDAVRRSLLVLRGLSDRTTGGMVAALTTSLPEDFGGERNWDYRYCWLRDAALTLEALLVAGYRDKAAAWRDWLVRAIAGDPTHMQIMYTVRGGIDLPERELEHLPGYADSRPVRIGNGAVDQRQTDVLGEVMVAFEMARERGLPFDEDSWRLQAALVDDLADHWEDADHGIWEIRGPLHHFTHSRVMVWAAMDRAVRLARSHDLPGDVERWESIADAVRTEVLERGYDTQRGTFVQHYDTDEVDASLLLLPTVGFIAADDERFVGTVRAIEEDLLRDGLVLRYRTESGVDGLEGDEHPFVICCFWLVSAYARMGRLDDAEQLMDRLVALTNDVGLLAEECDADGTFSGNFPQAFSHLGLVRAAYDLQAAREA